MSKYYKAENVQTLINSLRCYGIPELNLDGLPTIEVSEDCISREDAVNALIAHFIPRTYTGEEVEQASELARKIMANAPSVTTEQSSVVGEWIFQECFDEHYGRAYECSLCGEWVVGKHNYCPNCGADMRGEKND